MLRVAVTALACPVAGFCCGAFAGLLVRESFVLRNPAEAGAWTLVFGAAAVGAMLAGGLAAALPRWWLGIAVPVVVSAVVGVGLWHAGWTERWALAAAAAFPAAGVGAALASGVVAWLFRGKPAPGS